MRGNPQSRILTLCGLPRKRADTYRGHTTTDVGRTPRTRRNPQCGIPMLGKLTHRHRHDILGVVRGGGEDACIGTQWPTMEEMANEYMQISGAMCPDTQLWTVTAKDHAEIRTGPSEAM